jgi:hypothetical protein
VNHQDISGLSSLHYACIRGKLDVVEKLLGLNANPYCMNTINYSPLTYSLCYISFMQYIDTETYTNRLKIVKLLIDSIHVSKIKQCIVGMETMPNLVALFNFIFYGLSQTFVYIEQLGWSFYNEIIRKATKTVLKSIDDQLFTIGQYLVMYNQNVFYFNYFIQRIQLTKLNDFLLFYLVNFYNAKKNYLRINLLILYSLLSDDGEALRYVVSSNSYDVDSTPSLLDDAVSESFSNENLFENNNNNVQGFIDNDNLTPNSTIYDVVSTVLKIKSKKPFSLKCLCRRRLRFSYKHSIFYVVVNELDIPSCLKKYLLYEELNDYVHVNDCSMKFMFEFLSKI